MGKDDCREYHRRAAARLRSLAEYRTTKAIKARLIARPNSLQANTSGLLCFTEDEDCRRALRSRVRLL